MVDQGMVQVLNEKYLRKAVSGRRALQENLVRPEAIVTLEQKEDGSAAVIKREEPGRMRKIPLSSGGRLILDFGDHQVGPGGPAVWPPGRQSPISPAAAGPAGLFPGSYYPSSLPHFGYYTIVFHFPQHKKRRLFPGAPPIIKLDKVF